MTFDDEDKPMSQNLADAQASQSSESSSEPQPAAWSQVRQPNAQQTYAQQPYVSTAPPVREVQPGKRGKQSKIVVLAIIVSAVFLLIALVVGPSSITMPLIAGLAVLPTLLSILSVIFTRKNGEVKGRIGAFVAVGVTVVAIVVMGGRMAAYAARAKAEHEALIAESCQPITWPDGDFAKKLPALANQKGKIYIDSSDRVSIELCDATQSSFDTYVKDAKKAGFTIDYEKSSYRYTAKDSEGNEVTVFFREDEEDGNTMHITLEVPESDDDSESQGSDDQQQSQDTQSQQQSQDTQQDQQNQQDQQSDPAQVSADFKASMDSYEQFFDQYVEFMKEYKDSGDSVSMLADYTKMMEQYSDTMNKLNAVDQNSLSAADEAYYIEVMGRITQKLASVA